jgi:glycerophosphoryl diester phosphodiesterase
LLAAHGAAERATIGSFHPAIVHRVRRLGHPGPTALTAGEIRAVFVLPWPFGLLARARAGRGSRAAMIPTCYRGIRLDGRRFVARCRRLGLRVDYWVVNDAASARRLLDRGATGIVTDDPGRLASSVLPG